MGHDVEPRIFEVVATAEKTGETRRNNRGQRRTVGKVATV